MDAAEQSLDVELECATEDQTHYQKEHSKLIAKFKLVSKCSNPHTFEYSIEMQQNDNTTNSANKYYVRGKDAYTKCIFDSLAKFDGKGYKIINREMILKIKPLPFIWPKQTELHKKLLELEKYFYENQFTSSPYVWMVKRRIIKQQYCIKCKEQMSIGNELSLNHTNQSWVCICGYKTPLDLPLFVRKLRSIENLAPLIYCWSSRDDNVETTIATLQSSNINDTYIVYRSLQALCGRIILRDRTKLASIPGFPVEIATIQIGSFFILGAMETKTKAVRMCAISKEELHKFSSMNVNQFVEICKKWIACPSKLLVYEKKFKPLVYFGYDITFRQKGQFNISNLTASDDNIGNYLILHMQSMLRDINTESLDSNTLNNFLHELEWREKYGYEPFTTFLNILTHIATDPLKHSQKEQQAPDFDLTTSIDKKWLEFNTGSSATKFPIDHQMKFFNSSQESQRSHNKSDIQKVDEYYIDEYFYGWWSPFLICTDDIQTKPECQFICKICLIHLDKPNFTKHIIEHLESCCHPAIIHKFCMRCNHCLRDYTPSQFHSHRTLMSSKISQFSCRICCYAFADRDSYLNHMIGNHWPREAPYVCPVCMYRSSFQRDIILHYIKEHSAQSNILCHICLELIDYDTVNDLFEPLHAHLSEHFLLGPSYACDRCSLTFTSETQKEKHLEADHGDPSEYTSTCQFIPYRLSKTEIPYSTIVNKEELQIPQEDQQACENHDEQQPDKRKNKDQSKSTRINFDYLNSITLNSVLLCLECKNEIGPNHFSQRAFLCSKCKRKSNCKFEAKTHECDIQYRYPDDNKLTNYRCKCGKVFTNIVETVHHMAATNHLSCTILDE